METKNYRIALAGNPNSGKSTLFNALTGIKQRIGNWPGVTVERKEGQFTLNGKTVDIVDLPGIYSFSAYSLDEKVSREYILSNQADLIVNILDASNLERSLYLTTQIIEMKRPLIVALNMIDVARQRRVKIDIEHLAHHLGCPVIPIVASKKIGLEELKEAVYEHIDNPDVSKTRVYYDSVVEEAIERIEEKSAEYAAQHKVDKRWLAIKLLEGDLLADELTKGLLQDRVRPEAERIKKHTSDEADMVILDGRYGFINGLTKDVIRKESQFQKTVSDSIDKVVLNRLFGVPIFLGIMYLVFWLTIGVGEPFIEFFEILTGTIFVDGFGHLLSILGAPEWLIAFLAGGIGGGIQTVSTFIPPIFFIFLSLSILEDSGYMARAAFVMDKFMQYIGLPGKAFIPMLVGFGCNVPAIMATRTLENDKDRLLTILINPLMSCGAKLPVYALFATIFFPGSGGRIIFSLYIVGIILAIISGFMFKKTLFRGDTSSFVMELPVYHIPTVNGIFMHTWRRLKSFVVRAGKVIMIAVIVLTILNSIGTDGKVHYQDGQTGNSVLSYIGRKITPVFYPMGISSDNWPATVGLMSGIFAKEVIIGTLDNLYSSFDNDIDDEQDETFSFWDGIREAVLAIPEGFAGEEEEETIEAEGEMIKRFGGANNAYAYLLFVLIYIPCLATIAVIYRETNIKWAVFAVFYLTVLAWIIATIYYQFSIFFVNPGQSILWIAISLAFFAMIYAGLKIFSDRQSSQEVE